MIDGEPWFVAKDVCNVLGVQQPARAVENLDSDEVSKTHITDSLNRQQETYIVNESGLYALVIRSNKPNARRFRKWITSEVLPGDPPHRPLRAARKMPSPTTRAW